MADQSSGFVALLEEVLARAGGPDRLTEFADVPATRLEHWRRGDHPLHRTAEIERVDASAARNVPGHPEGALGRFVDDPGVSRPPVAPPGPKDATHHGAHREPSKAGRTGLPSGFVAFLGALVGIAAVVGTAAVAASGPGSAREVPVTPTYVTVETEHSGALPLPIGPGRVSDPDPLAHLARRPVSPCDEQDCAVPDVDLHTGHELAADCYVLGDTVVITDLSPWWERAGPPWRPGDPPPGPNPPPRLTQRSSALWYHVSGFFGRGYLNEAYVRAADRGGHGLPHC